MERSIIFIGLQVEVQGERAFSGMLVLVSPELEGLCQGTVAVKGNVVNSLHPKSVIFLDADHKEVFPRFSRAFHCSRESSEEKAPPPHLEGVKLEGCRCTLAGEKKPARQVGDYV